MSGTLTDLVLQRLDREERPIRLGDEKVKSFAAKEVARLVSLGVLKKKPRIVKGTSLTDGRDMMSPRFLLYIYEVMIHKFIEAIRLENGISGEITEHGEDLFGLGRKTVAKMPTKVFLSTRNQNPARFKAICERVSKSGGKAVFVLVPCPVLLSSKEEKHCKKHGVVVVCLNQYVTAESWKLPWKKLQQEETRMRPVLRIVESAGEIHYRGQRIEVTPVPFRLLLELARAPGTGVPSRDLARTAGFHEAPEEIDLVKWATNHKSALLKSFRRLVGRNGISQDEIEGLIENKNKTLRLNLSNSDVSIE